MSNKDKYPEIWAAFEKASAEVDALMKETQPFRDEINKIGEAEGKLREKRLKLKADYADKHAKLAEAKMAKSRLARAMGGRSINAPFPA